LQAGLGLTPDGSTHGSWSSTFTSCATASSFFCSSGLDSLCRSSWRCASDWQHCVETAAPALRCSSSDEQQGFKLCMPPICTQTNIGSAGRMARSSKTVNRIKLANRRTTPDHIPRALETQAGNPWVLLNECSLPRIFRQRPETSDVRREL